MSYITCVVASCKTRRKPSTHKRLAIKCFSFPKDPVLKKVWLDLCKVSEFDQAKDCNRKVCIKHFKEDDFVDGLKARLLNLQPTRLKKSAVPSLHLSHESETDNTVPTESQEQGEMIDKRMDKAIKKKTQMRKPNTVCSVEYLRKLVPIAPKGVVVSHMEVDEAVTASQKPATKKNAPQPTERRQYSKLLEQHTNSGQSIANSTLTDHPLKVLQHDNAIYKKRISVLLESQNKLIMYIKELEQKLKVEKEDFVYKMKQTLAQTLTSNQIDIMLGKKIRVWWTDVEYSKAYTLQQISKQAYSYVRDTLNYPLPGSTTLDQWAAKIGAGVIENDSQNIKPPRSKRIKMMDIINDDNNKENHLVSEGNDLITVDMKINNQLSNMCDIESSSDNDSTSDEKLDLESDSVDCETDGKDNDHEYIDVDICEEDDVLYEQIGYIEEDDIVEDVIDGTQNNETDAKTNSDNDNDGDNEEFYEELVIETLSESEDNSNCDKSIEEDNG